MSQANFSDDAASVVQAIQDSVKTTTIDIDGKEFVTREVFFPPVKKDVSAIKIHSLEGLVEYLNEKVDGLDAEKLLIVVNSHFSVSIFSQVGDRKESRTNWINADFDLEGFPFGSYIDHEKFMVQAQARIVDSHDRANLLELVGNLTTAAIQTSTDNGISQIVVVEQGVRKSEVDLPNPVTLAPRRTFPEVEQPESPFVLRVKQSREGMMPEIALFEADGGLWKILAIQNIKDYLSTALEVEIPVIG